MHETEAQRLIGIIRSIHPFARFPEGAAATWAEILHYVDPSDAQRALMRLLRDNDKGIPTPADIIRVTRTMRHDQQAETGQRPMCVPCEREQGVRDPVTDTLLPPQRSSVGPQDRLGPKEPLCYWHLDREAMARHLERAKAGQLEHGCIGHKEPDTPNRGPSAKKFLADVVAKFKAREPGEEG